MAAVTSRMNRLFSATSVPMNLENGMYFFFVWVPFSFVFLCFFYREKQNQAKNHENFWYRTKVLLQYRPIILWFFTIIIFFVCVTEQHYFSIFFTRLWSVRKPMLFDTQNPGILGFSTAHAYKYKTKRQAKMKRDRRKMTVLLICHQAPLVLEKHEFAHRPLMSEENRNVVLFCYAGNDFPRSTS